MQNQIKQLFTRFITLFLTVTLLISCQLIPVTQQPLTESTTSTPFETPAIFQTSLLNPLDVPHTYIEEACRYFRNRWNPLNAKPGTVVMVILFNEINRGAADLPNSISLVEFAELMNQLKSQGFEAVNTEELQGFVERNEVIPERSVYLIQTGNHEAEYFNKFFRDYWENWKWTIINGWVSEPQISETLLIENIELENEGFVDHQAQGVFENTTLSDESAKNVIARELQGSWTGFANVYGKNPLAMIWQNGGFGFRPIEAARQLRFKMGFTSNLRGPIMYNWIPLANEVDPQRPDYAPEGVINEPLMTLPTFPAEEAINYIDIVRIIGEEATAYAELNKENEIRYYENVCEPEFPPIPSP
jgi:hypothetical protein